MILPFAFCKDVSEGNKAFLIKEITQMTLPMSIPQRIRLDNMINSPMVAEIAMPMRK